MKAEPITEYYEVRFEIKEMIMIDAYRNKVLGSMVGGAVGDALGYPVEFMSYEQIIAEYGPEGITRYKLNAKGVAEISDDTQMSLFTANGVLFTFTRYENQGVVLASPHDYVKDSYLEWLGTQTGEIDYRAPHYNWIRDVRALHARRAPGITCLSALKSIKDNYHYPVENSSKGCGGIMRTAPLALFTANPSLYVSNGDSAFWVKESAELAAITHKHPLGYLPSAYLHALLHRLLPYAYVTADMIKGHMNECMSLLEESYKEHKTDLKYMRKLLDRAAALAVSGMSDIEAIRQLGEGWVAEETLAIALYCVLKYPNDFEKAVVASVNHSGDSDSTGAVTGNIIGAIVGYDAIPQYYKDNLELRELIEEMADDIATGIKINDKAWRNKYVYVVSDNVPIANSYLVHSGMKIYAGEYPGDKDVQACKSKVGPYGYFHEVKFFYDLTCEGELVPYSRFLRPGTEHVRFPVPDCGVPHDTRPVALLLDRIIRNASDATGNCDKTYIHCWGGVGRTGTIVACLYAWLLKGKGLSADEMYRRAMEQLQDSFSRCPKSRYRTSPENQLQRDFVRRFIDQECM